MTPLLTTPLPDFDEEGQERGGAVNVQMALLWPVVLLMVFAVVQVGLVFYAGQLAATAAQEGVRVGRTSPAAPVSAAQAQAQQFLARTSGPTLTGVAVTASVDPAAATVQVRVTATVVSLVPGLAFPVAADAIGALEDIRP